MESKIRNKGITLIALVITTIVLLILAGVTIAALSGDNGILTRAKEAKENTEKANQQELNVLEQYEQNLNQYVDGKAVELKNVNKSDTNPTEAMPENVRVLESDANKGIVIKDKNNNEWVWVEVPKTIVFSGLTIDTTETITEQNYNDIKDKLIAYVGVYRNGSASQTRSDWTDEWYEGCGLTSEEYIATYQKMLKSIYTYGGFWIGRYEAGIEGSINDLTKARTSHSNIVIGTSQKAISQKDAIPYNYVYCSEAQALANEMAADGNCVSSLLFGIQWDLVCKFLEAKSELTVENINSDSNNYGNYKDVEKIITSKNSKKYETSWTNMVENKTDSSILLSTGASDKTKEMNIYDLAGNEFEWTLEKTSKISDPCAARGGHYYDTGTNFPISCRNNNSVIGNSSGFGFRVTLYK